MKLDKIQDSLCLTSLPTHIHKGIHDGGRREAPPPLWMGVGRLVRHKESLMGPTSAAPYVESFMDW